MKLNWVNISFFFKKENLVKAFAKSQETPSSQGHVLFSGVRRGRTIPSGKSLEETLGEAEEGELKIADHPEALIQKYRSLRYSKDKKKDASRFDSFELNGNFSPISMLFSIANYLARRDAKKYSKPLVANSDGHHPKDIGKTYNIFDPKSLNYSSEKAFRDSITYNVREGNFTTRFTPIPFWRVFHHALMMGVYKIFKR